MSSSSFQPGRYLVTGGAGFVGSFLCERLVGLGCEVVCVDNLITGRMENILPLLRSSSFEFIEQDVVQPLKISGGFRGVFHLASPASPVDYLKYPIETLKTGALGSDNVLALALEKQCRIVVASTSEVYGDPLEHPQKESYWGHVNTVGPRGCYDESKRYLEALTMAYHRVHGLSTMIVRIFNTYGPRMRVDDGRVVPNFCYQAISGTPITVYGDGSQTRSFCFVTDLIEGLLAAFGSNEHLPINLGNPNELSVLDFAKRIALLAGRDVNDIVYKPLPEDDPKVRCPDITRAKQRLGWEPRVMLDEGLGKTFLYFQDYWKAQ